LIESSSVLFDGRQKTTPAVRKSVANLRRPSARCINSLFAGFHVPFRNVFAQFDDASITAPCPLAGVSLQTQPHTRY
jgi:hypothetical protein